MSTPPANEPPANKADERRRVRLHIKPRRAEDPKGDLDFAKWCLENGIQIDGASGGENPPKSPSIAGAERDGDEPDREFIPDEPVEGPMREQVGQALEATNAEIDARSDDPDARQPESPREVTGKVRRCPSSVWNFTVAGSRLVIYEVTRAFIDSFKGPGG